MRIVGAANKYIDDMGPWKLDKEGNGAAVAETMLTLANAIRTASVLLSPFLVTKAVMALDELNVPADLRDFARLEDFKSLGGIEVNEPIPLFPRLDKEAEIKWLENLIDVK